MGISSAVGSLRSRVSVAVPQSVASDGPRGGQHHAVQRDGFAVTDHCGRAFMGCRGQTATHKQHRSTTASVVQPDPGCVGRKHVLASACAICR